MNEAPEQQEILRWFTRVKRVPKVIGKLPGGVTIPFGPFKLGAVLAGAFVAFVLYRTMDLWPIQSGLIRLGAVLVLSVATVFIANALPSVGRNPLLWFVGTASLLTASPGGTRDGRPLKINRPYQVTHRIAISRTDQETEEPTTVPAPAAPAIEGRPQTFDELIEGIDLPATPSNFVPPARTWLTPTPSPQPAPATLTGVGRLLAAAAAAKDPHDA